MTPEDIWELLGAFLAGSGVAEIIRWVLGKRTRVVQNTAKLSEGWERLVQEMREDREFLRKDLQTLSAWQDETIVELASLRTRIVLLQAEIQALKYRTEQFELENQELQEKNAILQECIDN